MSLEGGTESAALFASCACGEDILQRHKSGESKSSRIIV
jgi:hypothetical protein